MIGEVGFMLDEGEMGGEVKIGPSILLIGHINGFLYSWRGMRNSEVFPGGIPPRVFCPIRLNSAV